MEAKFTARNFDFRFDESDIVQMDDWIPAGEYNPHKVRPWLLHDHGFTVAVVFASHPQEALDAAADAGKLDRFQVSEADLKDYPDDDSLAYLGNASELFDIEGLEYVELPNPKTSFVAQFNARGE